MDAGAEESIRSGQEVNSDHYTSLHSEQMFSEGLSFSGFERDKLWVNRGDGFVDLSALSGADSPNDGRAAIACDFDDDGDVDLFVHNIQRERHGLYRNDLQAPGGFLKLRLRATGSNPEAVGATVFVHGPHGPTAQVLSRGGGFVTCQAPELVFGLGGQAEAEVEVLWPGGARESFGALAAGTRAVLVEGRGRPEAVDARTVGFPKPLPAGLKVAEGDRIGPLALRDADGAEALLDPVALADGRPLLVALWATYCPPCVAEIGDLQRVHARGEQRVVAISVDGPSAVGRAAELLEQGGARYPAFYLGGQGDGESTAFEELVDLARLPIPTTLVLSPEGRVETILRGPLTGD